MSGLWPFNVCGFFAWLQDAKNVLYMLTYHASPVLNDLSCQNDTGMTTLDRNQLMNQITPKLEIGHHFGYPRHVQYTCYDEFSKCEVSILHVF